MAAASSLGSSMGRAVLATAPAEAASAKRSLGFGGSRKFSFNDAIAAAKNAEAKKQAEFEAEMRIKATMKTDATKCVVRGEGITTGMAKRPCQFTIESHDVKDRKRINGGDVYRLTASGPSSVIIKVRDNRDGTYTCEYLPTVSGLYHINATLGGVSLNGSPWAVQVLSCSADSEKCVLSGAGLTEITARDPSFFEVEFVDALGQATHAEELDVFVVPREEKPPEPPKPTAEELAAAQKKEEEEKRQAAGADPSAPPDAAEEAMAPRARARRGGVARRTDVAAAKTLGKVYKESELQQMQVKQGLRTEAEVTVTNPFKGGGMGTPKASAPSASTEPSPSRPSKVTIAVPPADAAPVPIRPASAPAPAEAPPLTKATLQAAGIDPLQALASVEQAIAEVQQAIAQKKTQVSEPRRGRGPPSQRGPPSHRGQSSHRGRRPESADGGSPSVLASSLSSSLSLQPRSISPPRSRHEKPEKEEVDRSAFPPMYNPHHATHPKLDGAERQRHIRLWNKQLADEQNRYKAEEYVAGLLMSNAMALAAEGLEPVPIENSKELQAAAAGPSFASEIGAVDIPGSPKQPTVGFAYGGVYPGTIHAHGAVIQKHAVQFAVGRAGTYWLHVGLRSSCLPLPGSPFQLKVLPGRAHAISTRIPEAALPLRTVVGESGKLIIHAADRMGNLCEKGDDPVKASEPSGSVECSTSDLGTGEYEIKWHGERAGSYALHIDVAGSDVYGSPVELIMAPGAPNVEKCEAIGTGLNRALAGRHAYLRIKSRDKFGNATLASKTMRFGMSIIQLVKKEPQRRSSISDVETPWRHKEEAAAPVADENAGMVPQYTDDEIYGITRAAAEAAAAALAEQTGVSLDEFTNKDQGEEKKAEAPAAAEASTKKKETKVAIKVDEEKEAEEKKPKQNNKQRRGSTAGPKPEAGSGDKKGSKEAAAERKAAEEADAAKRVAEKKRKEDEERKKAVHKHKITPKSGIVESIHFEGAWRPGGEFEIRYIAKEAGTFFLHIWCDVEGNGERHRLPGSPYNLHVTAAPPSATGSNIWGVEKTVYVAGEKLELMPQLRDAFGNATSATDESRSFTNSSAAERIMKELFAQHGIAGVTKAPPKSAIKYSETGPPAVEQQDGMFEGSEVSSPSKMRMMGFGSSERSAISSVSGVTAISTSPTKGRRLYTGLGPAARQAKSTIYELTSWMHGPKGTVTLPLKPQPDKLGLYSVGEHVLTLSGNYEVHFHLNGQPIKDSPISFQVVAGEASGRNSYVTAPEQPAFVKLPYELKLFAVDRYNNRLLKGGTRVEGKVVSGSASACTCVDHKDGTYSLHFTVNQVGSYSVEVRVEGNKVKGVPGNAKGGDDAKDDKKVNKSKVKKRRESIGGAAAAAAVAAAASAEGGSPIFGASAPAPSEDANAAPLGASPGATRAPKDLKDVSDLTATI